jgi:predicted acyl esterase
VTSARSGRSAGTGRYRCDPARPTAAVGGIRVIGKAGRVNNAELEARDDVLTFTTAAVEDDAEVIGEIAAEIRFRSSLPYAGMSVRLCDVDSESRNLTASSTNFS